MVTSPPLVNKIVLHAQRSHFYGLSLLSKAKMACVSELGGYNGKGSDMVDIT